MTEHTVQKGECLSAIAWSYGFERWETVYEAPENEEFRKLRPNPNVIYPGDVIVIPDQVAKDEDGASEKRHNYRVNRSKWLFRARMLDERLMPLTGQAYKLSIEDEVVKEAETDGDGMIEVKIPAEADYGMLTFMGQKTELRFAGLDPVARVTGVQQRLNNLGFFCGPVDGIVGPLTRSATYAFQRFHDVEPTGLIDDATRLKLLEVHDNDDRSGSAEDDMSPTDEVPPPPPPTVPAPEGGFKGFKKILTPDQLLDGAYVP